MLQHVQQVSLFLNSLVLLFLEFKNISSYDS